MIIKDLIEFGLSEKEAKTYLALLKLELATVQEIARSTGINRSTTYVTLESLKKKGFVSVSDDKSVRKYVATPPEGILRVAEDNAAKYESIRERIETIIPEMKALHRDTKARPTVRIFEGTQGLISGFEDTLKSKEKLMRVASSVEGLMKILPGYMPEYIQKRYKAGVKMRGIHPNDEAFKILTAHAPKNFDTYVSIPEDTFKFPADLAIYDNTIAYMSHVDHQVSVLIESKEMADVMKNLYDLAWEEAKRLNKTTKRKPRD